MDGAAWPRNEYFELSFSDTPLTYTMKVRLRATQSEENGLKNSPAFLASMTT